MSPHRLPGTRGFHSPRVPLRPIVALMGALASGCATTGKPAPRGDAAPTQLEMEPIHITASGGPTGLQVEAFDAQELFERAGAALSQKKPDEALALYDRLLANFPDSTYTRAAHYNRGLALQDRKDWARAVETFRSFVDRYGAHADAKDALFQLGASHAELTEWLASAEVFARLLSREDLTADDRIEAIARRGFAQFNVGDLDGSERTFRSVVAYRDQIAAQERLATDFYVAFALYHLGQVSHSRFRAVALRLPEPQMDRDIEDKARLLLDAQRRYIDTIKVGHPAWASAAGYQVGSLYEELYDAFVGAPVPDGLSAEARTLYGQELQKKIRVLLEKSVRWYRENMLMMERVGASSEWAEKSKVSYGKLLRLLDPSAARELGRPNGFPASESAPPPPGAVPPAAPLRDQAPIRPEETTAPRQIL